MKLTGEEARHIVWDDSEDWAVIEDEITDNSRWSIHHRCIAQHKPTGDHYSFHYSVGATEQQWEQPFECEDTVEPCKVVQKEVTVTQWVAASEDTK